MDRHWRRRKESSSLHQGLSRARPAHRFWEYTCINCIRDFSVLKRWYRKYRPYDFDVVGVHFGEFPMGFSADNVRDAAERFELPWPIVADLHGSIWNEYHSNVWPNR